MFLKGQILVQNLILQSRFFPLKILGLFPKVLLHNPRVIVLGLKGDPTLFLHIPVHMGAVIMVFVVAVKLIDYFGAHGGLGVSVLAGCELEHLIK